MVDSGSVTSTWDGSSGTGVDPDQIGLGKVDVTFLVPQPTKNIALASKKVRLPALHFVVLMCELSSKLSNISLQIIVYRPML